MTAEKNNRREAGRTGERIAADWLLKNGYEIVEQNYYFQRGEIDIIARDGGTLVFVEVKYRTSDRFGEPEESVTPKKQELLRRTAEGYVAERNITDTECRFDVVTVLSVNGTAHCRVLKNCF